MWGELCCAGIQVATSPCIDHNATRCYGHWNKWKRPLSVVKFSIDRSDSVSTLQGRSLVKGRHLLPSPKKHLPTGHYQTCRYCRLGRRKKTNELIISFFLPLCAKVIELYWLGDRIVGGSITMFRTRWLDILKSSGKLSRCFFSSTDRRAINTHISASVSLPLLIGMDSLL